MTERGPRQKTLAAPLAPVALAVVVGIVADRFGEPLTTRAWATVALAGGAVALAALFVRESSLSSILAGLGLLAALVALGGAWHHHSWSDLAADDLARSVDETPRPAWVRGVLTAVLGTRPGRGPADRGTTRAQLEVAAVRDGRSWRRARGSVQLVIVGGSPVPAAGEAVMAAGTLAAIAGPLNPGEFDYRAHMRAQGIRLRLTVDEPGAVWLDLEPGVAAYGSPLVRWLGSVRAWSRDRLVGALDPAAAPLAAALLLGDREGVSADVNDAFARTGTTHLLAISGLHLQVLAGVLWFVFRALGLGRRGAFAAVAGATIAYALLVGLMPSVVRSAAMTCTICAAGFFDRRHRPANTLALAALVTLGLNPSHLFDVGCQLSFLAIAAMAWGVRPVSDLLWFAYVSATFRFQGPGSPLDVLERSLEPWWLSRLRRWPLIVTAGVVVSVVVWLAALPLVALRFHVVAPIGILLNIPLIPLTSLALMASGLTLGLSAVWEPLGQPFAWFSAWCLAGTEIMVRWGASRSWGHVFTAGPSWAWVLVLYLVLGVATAASACRVSLRWRRWAWRALAVWIVAGAAAVAIPRRGGPVEADVLAVGHGLAVVVRTPDGRTLLYDCGRMHDPNVGRRIIAPALWSRGIGRLDSVILSHADADHYNGLPDLLDRFRIAEVRVPPGFEGAANPGAARLLQDVRAREVPVRPIAEGDRWEWGGTRFAVWHPPAGRPAPTSDNARSVVLEVESNSRRLLLTGDLEREGLDRLLSLPRRPLDAFLSPHHGGRTANPERLYAWASPGLVVVSQRPPAAGTRDALVAIADRNMPVLRTWQRGAIQLNWKVDRLVARGFLDNTAGGWFAVPQKRIAFPSPGQVWWRVLASLTGFGLDLWASATAD